MRFKNGVKDIKAAAYSEWRTYGICNDFVHPYYILPKVFSFDYPYFWIMSYDTFLCFLTVEMSKSLKTSVIRFTYIPMYKHYLLPIWGSVLTCLLFCPVQPVQEWIYFINFLFQKFWYALIKIYELFQKETIFFVIFQITYF